jgi:hypothetical protein
MSLAIFREPLSNAPFAEAATLPLFYLDPTGSQAFASVNATFVVITVDPDAITPQDRTIAQARHFVGPNFKVQAPGESTGLLTNSTPALSDWFPPGPPSVSFPHRSVSAGHLRRS